MMKALKTFVVMTAGAVIGRLIVDLIEKREQSFIDPNEEADHIYNAGYRDGYLARDAGKPFKGSDLVLRERFSEAKMVSQQEKETAPVGASCCQCCCGHSDAKMTADGDGDDASAWAKDGTCGGS